MPNYLDNIEIDNPIIGKVNISLINPKTNKPYSIVAFVGENGCGKTTILNELSKNESHNYIFLRQNSLFIGSTNESFELISGQKDFYPSKNNSITNDNLIDYINDKNHYHKLLKSLNDDSILDIFESGKLDKSRCNTDLTKIIDGKNDYFNLSELSSGQQEILLKLKLIKNLQQTPDYVLLDEPETSLHPRWQKQIVPLIKEMLTDKNGIIPQLFLATHSERVLEYLIQNDDALIVRLEKKNNEIQYSTINQIDLVLPRVTFAELDYIIFKIDSFEYCNELYDLLEQKTNATNQRKIDKMIIGSRFYDESIYYKEWVNERTKESTYSVVVYCRNYFHHPKDREVPSLEELHNAIELLRVFIKNLE